MQLPQLMRIWEWWLVLIQDQLTSSYILGNMAVPLHGLDIHVISPLQDLTLYAAASIPGHAMDGHGCAVQADSPPV